VEEYRYRSGECQAAAHVSEPRLATPAENCAKAGYQPDRAQKNCESHSQSFVVLKTSGHGKANLPRPPEIKEQDSEAKQQRGNAQLSVKLLPISAA
jgi:hypothetical protein